MAQAKRSSLPAPLPLRMWRLHLKLIVAALFGVAIALMLPATWRLPSRLLSGWDAGIVFYLLIVHAGIYRGGVDSLRRRAKEQDEGAFLILLLTICAAIASIVAIVFELGGLKQAPPQDAISAALLALATILLSWGFVHTIFAIHYAHEYYGERRDGKIGGLRFPGEDHPDYWDFLYFSLVIGMTSQVSDVAVTSRVLRRVVSMHGVLSFFFNVSVLALTVNLLSNLI
jgi:uncharacterized membrane protein